MLIFNNLVFLTIILSFLYLLLCLYIYYKLYLLYLLSKQLNIRKLFLFSCLLTSFLRFLSFITLSCFNLLNYNLKSSLKGEDNISNGKEEFFDKAMIVLFDFPDFSIISAYMLIAIVWAESFLQSRRHWLSSTKYQRGWLIGYLIFNTILYTIQVALYSLLLLPSVNMQLLTEFIYLTLTSINIVLPIIWLFVYCYLVLEFAGFPIASNYATLRLNCLTKLIIIWTFSRVAWGIIVLTTVLNRLIISYDVSITAYGIEIMIVFIFTEIIPIYITLGDDNLQSLTGYKYQVKTNDKFSNALLEASKDPVHSYIPVSTDNSEVVENPITSDIQSPVREYVHHAGSFDESYSTTYHTARSTRTSGESSEHPPRFGGWLWWLGY